ncbi:conjugation protein [Schizosaccharomyces japonicus yFS275]|uniref:Plasma membrane fusion protein PRM1 n=1 Tax=Schizosaccharomyces japonicus (strain yFS275 / FY16936) TaxID=402676 RepID=B6JWU5_SCHJY|nr:conjugation protein [Schizosaccharomyces japonicus yFS275]EEB05846.1 conjugation protein [Schizosaccharomyces japonicus yFS275]
MNAPYLQLGARLSQCWLNPYTVICLYILVKIIVFSANFKKNLNTVQTDLVKTCLVSQQATNDLLKTPAVIAKGASHLIASGIQHSVKAMYEVLIDAIIALEGLIIFFIKFIYGTYLCLIQLTVNGSLTAIADVGEKIGDYVNSTLKVIANGIASTVSVFQKVINNVDSRLTIIAKWIGENVTLPNITIPELDKLRNFSIPSSFDSSLEKLKTGINFDSAINATEKVIREPLDKLKVVLKEQVGNFSFNESILPIPAVTTVYYCDDLTTNNAHQVLGIVLRDTIKVVVVILVALCIWFTIPAFFREWWTWTRIRIKASGLLQEFTLNEKLDPIRLVTSVYTPFSSLIRFVCRKLSHSPPVQYSIQWFFLYVTHQPALLILGIGLAGVLASLVQLYMLRKLQAAIPKLSTVANYTMIDTGKILSNVSNVWANETNQVLLNSQNHLNTLLFSYVNSTTSTFNNTLNTFMNGLNGTLFDFFNGTLLESPLQSVMKCLVYNKIENIEKAITWIHEKAHISFPTVPNNLLNDTIANETATNSNNTSNFTRLLSTGVNNTIITFQRSASQELRISLFFVYCWCAICFAGILAIVYSGTQMAYRNYKESRSLLTVNTGSSEKDNKSRSSFEPLIPVPPRSPPPRPPRSPMLSGILRMTGFSERIKDARLRKMELKEQKFPLLSTSKDLATEFPLSPLPLIPSTLIDNPDEVQYAYNDHEDQIRSPKRVSSNVQHIKSMTGTIHL